MVHNIWFLDQPTNFTIYCHINGDKKWVCEYKQTYILNLSLDKMYFKKTKQKHIPQP